MNSSLLPTDISRSEGCTLTGVLSVTGFLEGAVTVIHGPSGCTHHNASLLHASLAEIGDLEVPRLVSSNLQENEVIFGGEAALEEALRAADELRPGLICVVSTCLADTIGDDTAALCREKRSTPVVHIPGAGFLGGGFSEGIKNALRSLLTLSSRQDRISRDGEVLIVGEKNLEYEAEENYCEVARLLSLLGLHPGIRFVRRMTASDCARISSAPLAILRDPGLIEVGSDLTRRFGTTVLPGFPVGPDGTLRFLKDVGEAAGINPLEAIRDEEGRLDDLYARFDDLVGAEIRIDSHHADPAAVAAARTVIRQLNMTESETGTPLRLPFDPPIGTEGTKRMLHLFRRCLGRA
ncbi:MAG: oxidoreductase [Methanocalculus sp. MSAO_Arc1]|uniref:nitrogenase component 1 n=1 Tax=Methanocalculus sp. MSAO_Arc1 TaxID=2293854 RepID=UPI000FF85CCD|nr:nitrogenase component 1 [Methanocalculus sp. MSAO_Arc1]RQD80141.1 MAG: oxidoreductase [Methanocalculus sp. MSAO_Arc1]